MHTQIGLLLPSSTIFPIAKEFEKGLKAGLGNEETFKITREFIGPGGVKQTEDAINKLFNFDEVDIITGILSGKVTEYIAPKFASGKKPLIVSELGEYIPNPQKLNEYIFVNSHHIWQHAWTLGNWGVKELGKKGMFIGSVYDAGYNFSYSFHQGMMAADANADWSFSVPPAPPPGKLSDMSVIFPFLEKYEPDFIFAVFCGTESTLFLNEFIRRGWHKKTRVTGLPFLLDPFVPLEDDITIYTTLPDSSNPEMMAGEAFYYLGRRAGNILSAMETNNLHSSLLSNDAMQRLGETHFVNNANNNEGPITIIENKIKANQTGIDKKIVANTGTFSLLDEKLEGMVKELNAGWLNPYLCI